MEKPSTSPPSPLSPTLWPPEAFSAARIALFIGALVLAGLLSVAFAAIGVRIDGHSPLDAHHHLRLTGGVVLGQLLAYLPLLLVTLPLLPRIARRSLAELGLRPLRRRDVTIALIGTAGMYLAAALGALIQENVLHINGKETAVALFGTTHDPVLLAGFIGVAVIFAPFVEELVFRGFLFNALLRYVPAGVAIGIDGVLFGAGHLDINAAVPLAFGGAVLAAVYYRTGSLSASMLTHALFNAANVVLILIAGGKGS
ncbi:MAG: hypothetical protein NVSMB64_29400 [Candidatus Velthaea sp.]